MLTKTAICWSILLAVVHAAPAQDLGTDAQREAGRAVYMDKCAQCHGESGAGDGVAARFFRPAPRDFTSGLYKFRSTANGELPTHEDLVRSIRNGMPYTGMPAWPRLSKAEVDNVAHYLKTFNHFFSNPAFVPEVVEIPDAPSFSIERAARGREVYVANQCSDCHGDQGRGDGKSAPTLEDQWEQPIRPADLTKRWTFRNGTTRQDIYRTFTTGLDGTPMPSFTDIAEEDRWALVDYVYSLSRDEAGYDALLVARAVPDELDLARGAALFEEAEPAYFPVVGQVVEPGRAFHPGVNGVEVRAVYNEEEIAFLLVWHDMTADVAGANGPDLPAPSAAEADTTGGPFSDAVAIQLPSTMPEGAARPYFIFGDDEHPVDVWFADLAAGAAARYEGRGSDDLQPTDGAPAVEARYEAGAWTAAFKHARRSEGGLAFEEDTFVPVAFSVWDGLNRERGPRRGLTSWYHVYLAPAQEQSAALPMARAGLLTLFLELAVVYLVRRAHKRGTVPA